LLPDDPDDVLALLAELDEREKQARAAYETALALCDEGWLHTAKEPLPWFLAASNISGQGPGRGHIGDATLND
jgi:hypothetical protein